MWWRCSRAGEGGGSSSDMGARRGGGGSAGERANNGRGARRGEGGKRDSEERRRLRGSGRGGIRAQAYIRQLLVQVLLKKRLLGQVDRVPTSWPAVLLRVAPLSCRVGLARRAEARHYQRARLAQARGGRARVGPKLVLWTGPWASGHMANCSVWGFRSPTNI